MRSIEKELVRLTDMEVRAATPRERPYRISEAGGLSLLVQCTGRRSWQLRYRFLNRKTGGWSENVISLGSFPKVSLKEARVLCAKAREALDAGDRLSFRRRGEATSKRRANASTRFEVLANEWLAEAKQAVRWAPKTEEIVEARLAKYILPVIGALPIATLTQADFDNVYHPLVEADFQTALVRVRAIMREIFDRAVACGAIAANPIPKDERLPQSKVKPVTHYASLTSPAEVAPLMRGIRNYRGSVVVESALQLLPLVFVRPGELQGARWTEFDLDNAMWLIPAERMKMRKEHLVPLSRQAVAILTRLKEHTGDGKFVFTGANDRKTSMSENAIRSALASFGYLPDRLKPHGFRAMARTMLDEQLQKNPHWIEAQLAHASKNPLGAAYNRSTYLQDRRTMMQDWADYLDKLAGQKD